MNKSDQLWKSLEDEEYRRAFIADDTGLAFQIKLIRDKKGWTQAELGERAGGKRQETISQWESPNYGRYSLSTLKELAVAFDIGLMVRFAPFSELVEWNASLTPERLAPPSFTEENQTRQMPDRVLHPGRALAVTVTDLIAMQPTEGFVTTEPTEACLAAGSAALFSLNVVPSGGIYWTAQPREEKDDAAAA